MSINERLKDAEILWKENQKEGAWIMAMIAAAATARKRYPKPISDSKAFKQFIRDETWVIIKGAKKPVNHKGLVVLKLGSRKFEDILYDEYRCFWIHEASLKSSFLTKTKLQSNAIQRTLVVGNNIGLPEDWVFNLILAIRQAQENN